MPGRTRRLTTWYWLTRACNHSEAVRVAGPLAHRAGILATLSGDACSHCAGWPTRAVAPSAVRFDARRNTARSP